MALKTIGVATIVGDVRVVVTTVSVVFTPFRTSDDPSVATDETVKVPLLAGVVAPVMVMVSPAERPKNDPGTGSPEAVF